MNQDLDIKQINEFKSMPMEYRAIAKDQEEAGREQTAKDYRQAADAIETLLNVIGIPAFRR